MRKRRVRLRREEEKQITCADIEENGSRSGII
jgi:hypothetical protein